MAARWCRWARGVVCSGTGLVTTASGAHSCCWVFETAVGCLVLSSLIPNQFDPVGPTTGLLAGLDNATLEGGSHIVGDGGLEEEGAYVCVPFQV